MRLGEPAPHPRHVAAHLEGVPVAIVGVALQGAVDDRREVAVDAGDPLLDRRRPLVEDAVQDAGVDPAGKRLLQRDELVQHGAGGEDVAAVVDDGTGHLLRAHVVDRPEHHAALRHPRIGQARDAEIEDLQHALGVDHQVGGLDVAVDDAGAVRVCQPRAELLDHQKPLGEGQRRGAAQDLRERLAGDVLHRHEGQAVGLADVEDDDDVLVAEAGDGPGLADEPLAELLVVLVLVLEHLDGDEPLETRVPSQVERPHAAGAETALHLVLADVTGGHGVTGLSGRR